MSVLLLVLAAVGGLALLWKAADLLVDGASACAARLSIPPVVVGAVVIGLGTSAPEALVSLLAATQGSLPIAVGNIVGSNTANLSLVLGTAALLGPVLARHAVVVRDLPVAVLATVVLALAVQGGLSRGDGLVLLALLVVAVVALTVGRPASRAPRPRGAARPDVLRLLGGLVGVLAGAQLLVTGARGLAESAGLSEGFVGLTLVAIGTSAPELATAIAAARRKESELVVGNVLGSNVFNSLLIGGLVGVVAPGTVDDPGLTLWAVAAMLLTTAIAVAALLTARRVVRWEGAALLAVWLGLLPLSL